MGPNYKITSLWQPNYSACCQNTRLSVGQAKDAASGYVRRVSVSQKCQPHRDTGKGPNQVFAGFSLARNQTTDILIIWRMLIFFDFVLLDGCSGQACRAQVTSSHQPPTKSWSGVLCSKSAIRDRLIRLDTTPVSCLPLSR